MEKLKNTARNALEALRELNSRKILTKVKVVYVNKRFTMAEMEDETLVNICHRIPAKIGSTMMCIKLFDGTLLPTLDFLKSPDFNYPQNHNMPFRATGTVVERFIDGALIAFPETNRIGFFSCPRSRQPLDDQLLFEIMPINDRLVYIYSAK